MVSEVLHRRLTDNFDLYRSGSDGSPTWDPTGGTWTVTSNKYQAQTSAVGHKSIIVGLTLLDLRVEFVQNWTTANNWNVGFCFRAEDGDEENDCYFVTLQSGGLYLIKYVAGTPTTLASYSFSPATSTDYTLKIHCKGEDRPLIRVWLDGTLRINKRDDSSPITTAGTLGFVSQSSGSETILFDTVDLWGIETRALRTHVSKSIGSRITAAFVQFDNPNGIRSRLFQDFDDWEVWKGTTTLYRIFRGFIENPRPYIDEEGRHLVDVRGRDYTAELLFRFVLNESFSSQELKTTLSSLLTEYAPNFTQTNMANTGISMAPVYTMRRLFSIGRELASIAGFMFFANAERDITFQPETFEDSGITLEVGENIFAYDFPKPTTEIVNRVFVFGKTGIAVMVEDRELQESMGFIKEDRIVDPAIDTNLEARFRARARLAQTRGIRIGTLDTYGMEDLDVGQLVRVKIPKELIDGQYLVLGLDFFEPEMPSTQVTVAEFTTGIEDVVAGIKADVDTLLTTQADLTATLERWLDLQTTLEIDDIQITISRKYTNDSFILGHATYGQLGNNALGDRSGQWTVIYQEDNPD